MIVTVRAFASLRTTMQNETRLELEAESSIADLLGMLETRYSGLSSILFTETGQLNPLVNILKNGRNIQHLEGTRTVLEPGDLIAIFPPAAGG